MGGVSHRRLSHWKLPTGGYGTLTHNSAHVRLNLWIGVLVKCSRRTTRATSNRVAACNGIEASAGRRRRLTVLPEARLWSCHLHETRLGAGRQRREEGTLGNVSLDVTDTHMSDKVPRGEKENWSLEMGGLWRDRKHSVWGPGVSLDDWRPENRSVWVSWSPQIRQSAADWAQAGMSPTIMAVYGHIWVIQRMNDLGEKDGESGELQISGNWVKGLHPVKKSIVEILELPEDSPSQSSSPTNSAHTVTLLPRPCINIVSGVTGSMGSHRESVPSRPVPVCSMPTEDSFLSGG